MLSKLGYPIKGGFANGTGRSAYLSTCAVWEISSKNATGVPLKKKTKLIPANILKNYRAKRTLFRRVAPKGGLTVAPFATFVKQRSAIPSQSHNAL